MTAIPMVTLNDGWRMPQIGLGTYNLPAGNVAHIVEAGIRAGYRAIDTASIYGNEAGVGEGVRTSGEQIFVTTKLWNNDQGPGRAEAAFERSLQTLRLDHIDLYLIHWPAPARGLYVETWQRLVELRADSRMRSIGVSNFTINQLHEIIDASGVVPTVNQIELHPNFAQDELVAFHEEHGIATTSWSPLGQGRLLDDPVIRRLADKHRKSCAQIIVRWHLERGLIVIPKTSSEPRLRENLAVGNFCLDAEDMAAIATLDRADGRIGLDPMAA